MLTMDIPTVTTDAIPIVDRVGAPGCICPYRWKMKQVKPSMTKNTTGTKGKSLYRALAYSNS